jgi:glycosyltransferase involved in cell wall biosynthesis
MSTEQAIVNESGCARRLLVLAEYYYPAIAAGGPPKGIRTALQNCVDMAIEVFCRDRDHLSTRPYGPPYVGTAKIDNASVTYLSSKLWGLPRRVVLLIRHILRADVIWLNSLHSATFTVLPLVVVILTRRVSQTIMSPRGELAPAAWLHHSSRKKFWRLLLRLGRFDQRVHWLASSEAERRQILESFPRAVVSLVPERTALANQPFLEKRRDGPLRLLFLGRIAPIKGIEEGLKILQGLACPIHLTIAGQVEDQEYNRKLRTICEQLPPNIGVDWIGQVSYDLVPGLIQRHDALFAPSRTENFGHSIAEALALGRPAITTSETPWTFGVSTGAVLHVNADDVVGSARTIERFAALDAADVQELQERAYFLGKMGIPGGRSLPDIIRQVANGR